MENLSPSVKAVVRDSGSLQMQRKQTVKQVGSHRTNTVHFACFACRVAFKQPDSSNWNARVAARPFDCPNCKRSMVRLGRYFKAPPRRAVRQWLKVELLFRFGERFECANSRLDTKCDTLPFTVSYLVDAGHESSHIRSALRSIRDARRPQANTRPLTQKTRRTKR